MSQNYKMKFDEMRNNAPGSQDDNLHGSDAHVRKLRFCWPDGKSITMNYAYLISHEYEPAVGKITFNYTSEIITITGSNLEILDEMLLYNIPKKIDVTHPRYSALSTENFTVTGILVEKKK